MSYDAVAWSSYMTGKQGLDRIQAISEADSRAIQWACATTDTDDLLLATDRHLWLRREIAKR